MSYELANRGTTPNESIRRRSIASSEPILHTAQSIERSPSPEEADDASETPAQGTWQWPPQTLARGRFESMAAWTWDVLLTASPACFFGLAVAAIRLDGERQSEYGEWVVNLTRRSPTLYPILFTALASRFFRNLARWLLESDTGIPLGLLEQLFGSQSLAGTIERLLFVRVRVAVGFLVLVVWGLSPVGGQSALLLLRMDQGSDTHPSTIHYAHTLWQFKNFDSFVYRTRARASVNSMYTSSLLAPAHRGSPVDLWALPKIPQWPRNLSMERGTVRDISENVRRALSAEEEYYTSLLGVQIKGLEKEAEYNFTIETLYYQFDCDSFNLNIPLDQITGYIPGKENSSAEENVTRGFHALLFASSPDEMPDKSVTLEAQAPGRMLFASVDGDSFHLFNYTVRPVLLDTSITCNATSQMPNCHATRQTAVSYRYNSRLHHMMNHPNISSEYHRKALAEEWSLADCYDPSSTAKYLAGTTFSSGNVTAQWPPTWDTISLEDLSKRMTTLFNTYYDASVSAFSHANVALRQAPDSPESDHEKWRQGGQKWIPYLNSTEGVSTIRYPVYRVERVWVAALVVISMCLQALGILGLLLQGLIRGPDILGYASALTRENPHVGVPPGGSALDGPTRAKVLGRMYVQLADTLPGEPVGHIALREVGKDDGQDWRQLNSYRLYH